MSKGLFTSLKKNKDDEQPVEDAQLTAQNDAEQIPENDDVPSVEQDDEAAPDETVSQSDPNETLDPRDEEISLLKDRISELEKMMKFSTIEQGISHKAPQNVSLLDLMKR